jgi:quinol monooxygenase YgiN
VAPCPGHADAFLDAWQDFANWSCQMPGANLAVLARDLRDPHRFVSLIAWDNLEAIQKEHFVQMMRALTHQTPPGPETRARRHRAQLSSGDTDRYAVLRLARPV